MAKKATKAQIERRIKEVCDLLMSDKSRSDVMQYAAENWGLKTRATDTLIQKANVLIAKIANELRENAIERHLAQRAYIRKLAIEKKDERLALDILRDEAKLLNLYPSKKIEHTGKDGGPFKVISVASQDLDWDNGE